ncbi:MAG: amino acid adenylation domain-containing protein [Acidobacteriota bacterium]|nr:amino acid adenylation domain-containing protein [Acidobacteriota bacterium]
MDSVSSMENSRIERLTAGQKGLWLLHRLDPDSGAYNMTYAWRVKAGLDETKLEAALKAVHRRHPIWRSLCELQDGEPVRRVFDDLPVDFQVVDTDWTAADLHQRLLEETHRRFDLEKQPPVRWRVFRLPDDDRIIMLQMHHMAADVWSAMTVLNQLRAVYAGNDPASLPAPEKDLADFVQQQEEMLAGEEGERLKHFWQERLAGELAPVELPTDKARPNKLGFRADCLRFPLGDDFFNRMKTLAGKLDASPFQICVSAFQVFLHRYTGQRDIIAGVPTGGRGPEYGGNVGYFVNPVVMRAEVDPTRTFAEFLDDNKIAVRQAVDARAYPAAVLASHLELKRDAARGALFQVQLIWEDSNRFENRDEPIVSLDEAGNERWDMGEMTWERIILPLTVDEFDINLKIVRVGAAYYGVIEYNPVLFHRKRIETMSRHFCNLLEDIVTDPAAPIGRLAMLEEDERADILVERNATVMDLPEADFPRLFEDQVRNNPGNTAVVFDGAGTKPNASLSYAELNARANQLSHFLTAGGLGIEQSAGICMDRGIDMMVALLAVMKAGGTYVPMDPAFPRERLGMMVEDARMPILITQSHLLPYLPEHQAQTICLDSDWETIARQPDTNPNRLTGNDHRAYTIFTSGSTGRPKGVQLSHGNLVNFLVSMAWQPGMTASDVLVAVTTLSFDIAGLELYLPLITGARAVIVSRETAMDGAALLSVLERNKATVLQATPVTWRLMLEAGWDRTPDLKILCGGEALPADLAGHLVDRGSALWNMYGPTETTIWSTVHHVPSGKIPIAIGKPIANTTVYVVDGNLQPVPDGVAGELLIGGVGLARGYLDRPALTAQQFIPDLFSKNAGARLYRTGDLARWLADGNLECLGRIDHQVKIRGYRIELGEVEAVLAKHPDVAKCVVVVREDIPGDPRLAAYFTPEPDRKPCPETLTDSLRENLPDYMVPKALIGLDAFPLTPNKKIDRKALPAPDWADDPGETHVAPRNQAEQVIAAIWDEVLSTQDVGVKTDFFRLGGHSLLATKVLARIRKQLGVDISLPAFFNAPTVTGLAREAAGGLEDDIPPIQAVARDARLPLSFAQRGLWLIDRLQPNNPAYNIPYAYLLQGPLSREALEKALEQVKYRHESLRLSFAAEDGVPHLVFNDGSNITLKWISDVRDDVHAAELARREGRTPFNLETGPLFRCTVIQKSEESHLLVLCMHHMISDAWSMSILIDDLGAAYEAALDNSTPAWQPLPVQFADWIAWQKQRHGDGRFDNALTHIEGHLAESNQVLNIPADFPRPMVMSFNGAHQGVHLSPDQTRTVDELAEKYQVTRFMVLLTIYNALLIRLSGQDDILIGTPVANRGMLETENQVGFFVNTLALRTKVRASQTVAEALEVARIQTLDSLRYQDLPFDLVVDKLQPDRDLSRNPLFQAMFSLQNTPEPAGSFGDASLSLSYLDLGISHFDLTLILEESGDTISGMLEYNTDLFKPETAQRMTSQFLTLLDAAAADSQSQISKLPLLSPAELEWLLHDLNQTEEAYDPGYYLHLMVADYAKEHPEKVAVIYEETRLSYAELNSQANRLAHFLRALDVGPDSIVGISMDRGPDMIVAMIAIWKAGGAYLPLDPAYPEERLAFMIEDADVSVIVTHQYLTEQLPSNKARLICLDTEREKIAERPDTDPDTVQKPDDLGYVIYTSGTTGKPKGVMLTQRNLSNLVCTEKVYGFTPEDKFLVFASLNFDASILLISMGLSAGSCLQLASRENLLGTNLQKLIAETGVSVTLLPPSVLPMMDPEGVPDLRVLMVGGEACNEDLMRKWAPGRKMWNCYGPTETTVWGSMCRLGWGPEDDISKDEAWFYTDMKGVNTPPPIGKAVANSQMYLLDKNLQLVPVGVPGEVYIGGHGVARGYINRPELSDKVFIPDPFSQEEGARLYKTGDLGRYREDGHIEYMGRSDHQVKIRGFRIELGEIEAVLREQKGVRNALVMVREDRPGDKRLAAYIATGRNPKVKAEDLRNALNEELPDYMVPSAFVLMEEFPLTASGSKVDLKALPKPGSAPGDTQAGVSPAHSKMEAAIIDIWKEILGNDQITPRSHFFESGGNSLLLAQVQSRLEEAFNVTVEITDLFQYVTVGDLANHLDPDHKQEALKVRAAGREPVDTNIAVIGMAGRFPKANDVRTLWKNLRDGVDGITFFSTEELIEAGVDPDLVNDPNYVPALGYMEDPDKFDARFFGYSPREARLMDPQQRVFLEECWHALEDAGYNPDTYPDRIGCFAGVSVSRYMWNYILPNEQLVEDTGNLMLLINNDKDFIATRASYKMNLRGPGLNVQTGCSTSLVAIHEAVKSILAGECEMAIAGGSRINVPLKEGYLYVEGEIGSVDGHCRAFDASATGTLGGSGVAAIVLKPLNRALEDGDTVHAVIKGIAINNDGNAKVGFTAPSIEGQAIGIAMAQEMAGVHPETITYIETHGTGTALGDPIEVAGLTRAFRAKTDKKQFCGIGSLKTSVGHMDCTAGVGNVIKAALALKHGLIPANLHYEKPNPKIDFENSPFYVVDKLTKWETDGFPRRAGVSSFGLGGTNAHAVMEEPPEQGPSGSGRSWNLLLLSARDSDRLDEATTNLTNFLKEFPETNLDDAAYTLQVGRKAFSERRLIVCKDTKDAIEALEANDPERIVSATNTGDNRPIVFMFPGQGNQYVDMGRELYLTETVFREEIDFCCQYLKPYLGRDLRDLLYPGLDEGTQLEGDELKAARAELNQMSIAQPAIFVIEYAMARQLMAWGLKPSAMIGHSISEYVVACMAGVFSLEDALRLVAARGRYLQQTPPGKMMTVSLPEDELREMISDPNLAIGVINSPNYCVVSGAESAVLDLEKKLVADEINCRVLHITCASHSPMMESVLDPFEAEIKALKLNPPRIPYVGNVTGTWIKPEEATSSSYWRAHLRGTVRWSDCMATLLEDDSRIFIEVGPGRSLNTFAKQQVDRKKNIPFLTTIRHPKEQISDAVFLMRGIGGAWMAGAEIDWQAFHQGEKRRRISLPGYPFERKRFWIDEKPPTQKKPTKKDKMRKSADLADWFYAPIWKPSLSPTPLQPGELAQRRRQNWLVFLDSFGLGAKLIDSLRAEGQDVIAVTVGERFRKLDERTYTIRPREAADHNKLIRDLNVTGKMPQRVAHLWTVMANVQIDSYEFTRQCIDRGFHAITQFVRALNEADFVDELVIDVISNNSQEVHTGDMLCPAKATLMGPLKVIPKEFSNIICRGIDIILDESHNPRLHEQLLSELASDSPDQIAAYRGRLRWKLTYEPFPLGEPLESAKRMHPGHCYMITGGMGGIGLILAEHIIENVPDSKLVLMRRSPVPERADWDRWLVENNDHPDWHRLRLIQRLDPTGERITVAAADVGSLESMRAVVDKVERNFHRIDGVIHAAGLRPTGAIPEVTPEDADFVLRPKVEGTLVLEEIFRHRKLDFIALFSSNSAVFGNLGFVDYSAANAYQDAFAFYHSNRNNSYTVAISWNSWPELRKDVDEAAWLSEGRKRRAVYEMTLDEGKEIFERILSRSTMPQVVVMPADLQALLEDIDAFMAAKRAPKAETAVEGLPMLQDTSGFNPVEQIVANIWKDLIGADKIGPDDNFFDLGGDSLLATSVAGRVRKELKVKISPKILFETPTVATLAAHITKELGENNPLLKQKTRAASPLPAQAVDPRFNPVEQVLAIIWKDLLGLDDIGPDDNFFDLGGDSLLATSIAGRLRKQLKVQISPKILFETPTVKTLGEHVAEKMGDRNPLLQPKPEAPAPVEPEPMPEPQAEAEPAAPKETEPKAKAPPPRRRKKTPEQVVTPPSGDTEEALAKSWRAVFTKVRIGRESHFYQLGGDDKSAEDLVGRINKTFHLALSPGAFERTPVLSDLADTIDTIRYATQDLWAGAGPGSDDEEEIEL